MILALVKHATSKMFVIFFDTLGCEGILSGIIACVVTVMVLPAGDVIADTDPERHQNNIYKEMLLIIKI